MLIVTIAQEPAHSLINWRFLVAFGGGSLLCFILVFGIMSIHGSPSLASRTMHGMAASMTIPASSPYPSCRRSMVSRGDRGVRTRSILHTCGRVSPRGNAGSALCLDDNSGIHHLVRGLALWAIRAGITHRCQIGAGSRQTSVWANNTTGVVGVGPDFGIAVVYGSENAVGKDKSSSRFSIVYSG